MRKYTTHLVLAVAAVLLVGLTSACDGTPEYEGCADAECDDYDDGYWDDSGDGDGDGDGYDGYDGYDGGYDDWDGYDGYDDGGDGDLVCKELPTKETRLLDLPDDESAACEASSASVIALANMDSSSRWAADAFFASKCDTLICVSQRSILRTTDFLSAFDFGYPAAAPGEVEISADLLALNEHGEFTLIFGVSSEHKEPEDVPPLHLGLVFDTSDTANSGVLERQRTSAYALAKSLRAGDYVSIAAGYPDGPLLLDQYEVSGPSDATLLATLVGIEHDGSTYFNLALGNLYASMEASFDPERAHRIILLTRPTVGVGIANIEHARTATMYDAGPGIALSAIAFAVYDSQQGQAPYNLTSSLPAATQAGQGSLILSTAPTLYGADTSDDFARMLDIAARDLHVDISLPPGLALAPSEDGAGQFEPTGDPEHLAPNSALVRTMRLTVCDPELLSLNPSIKITAHFSDPVTLEPKTFEREFPVAELMATTSPRAVKAQALLRSLDALHKLALCDDSAINQAIEVLQDAMSQLPDDADLPKLAMQMTKPLGMWHEIY